MTELSGDVRKVQETSQIRWLMYCRSAICKSGQFEFDSHDIRSSKQPMSERRDFSLDEVVLRRFNTIDHSLEVHPKVHYLNHEKNTVKKENE